jgi:signal transduction histidine kinase
MKETAMITHFKPIDVLRRAFPGIPESEAEEMISAGKVREYPPDTVLCHEGAIESTFYIILDGEVQVTKFINDAEARFLKYLEPGDFFGEMALIQNSPRSATVMTKVPTTVLEINKEAFTDLFKRSTSVSLALAREVSRRLRENNEMAIEDLRIKAKELADAYQQLAELDYARREFLTTIAHELRTPLTAANGFLQVIRMGKLQEESSNAALDTVTRNIQDIITLTNDILFLQEMDLILPEFQMTDVGGLVAHAVEQERTRAERNGVGFIINIAPNIPAISADPKSLERAIIAILDNAIKFSPEGGDVIIDVGHADSHVWVTVTDHGVGIPHEMMPRIFERFFHMDQVGVHMFRGLGLGLSIARQVIEQHGGMIDVKSTLGKGSTFTIWLKAIH